MENVGISKKKSHKRQLLKLAILTPLGCLMYMIPFHSPSTFIKGFLSLVWLERERERERTIYTVIILLILNFCPMLMTIHSAYGDL